MPFQFSKLSPTKKFVYVFLGVYGIGLVCWIWFVHGLLNPGPFVYAGIDPVPGAKEIFHSVTRPQATHARTEVWVFQIPREYYEKLYKDCTAIHYLPGPYLNPANRDVIVGTGAEKYIDPNSASCYDAGGDHFYTYVAEFNGDKLIVFHDD